jgi:hypothetical protein
MHSIGNAGNVVAMPRPDRQLVYVPPVELQAYWGYVCPKLAIVAKRSRARWIPEDVYHAVKNGTATLHIGEIEGDYVGFVVLSPSLDFDGQSLTVWAVYNDSAIDVIAHFEAEIVSFARQMRAKRITFTSPRGWGRRLKNYGYVATHQVFEKEV